MELFVNYSSARYEDSMQFWIMQLFYGLSYGSILFLFASGLSLIFGVMRIINIAHGSYYLLAGYLGFTVIRFTGSYLLGMVAAALGIALVGILMERIFLRGVSGNLLGQVLLTAGFAFAFQDLALVIWGGDPYTIEVPEFLSGSLVAGRMFFPRYRLFMLTVALVIGLGLWIFQKKTRAGAMIRAAVDNEEMARGIGINVHLLSVGVFALGAILAAIAGVIGGAFLSIYSGLDLEILPYGFVVVILGGRGSIEGAILGSIAVGLIDNLGKVFFPEFSYFTLFVPMALMLMIKPTGFFGKA
jgi:branched-chain amino acid transport system permease protein